MSCYALTVRGCSNILVLSNDPMTLLDFNTYRDDAEITRVEEEVPIAIDTCRCWNITKREEISKLPLGTAPNEYSLEQLEEGDWEDAYKVVFDKTKFCSDVFHLNERTNKW